MSHLSKHATCLAHLFPLELISLIIDGYKYCEAPGYAFFTMLLFLPVSGADISSTPCSQSPSVSPIVPEAKYHTHTEQQVNL